MGGKCGRGGSHCSPAAAWELAAAQHGRVARRQLVALGVPATTIRSWLRTGRLVAVHDGVYGFAPLVHSREARWMAAVLACGPGAMLSHLSGSAHVGIIEADGEIPDVTAPRSRRGPHGIRLHRPRCLPPAWTHRGIPVATVPHLLLGLAQTFASDHLERAIGEAERRALFDDAAVHSLLDAHAGRRGAVRLRRVLRSHEAGRGIPRNLMELRFRAIGRDLGLPEPESNVALLGWEVDFLWRELRIGVETDGRGIHARRAAFARDRRKDRDLQLAGYLALRFTYAEVVYQPATVRAALAAAAAARGLQMGT